MAEFINNDLTDRGRALLAGAQTGAIFQPVSIVLGSGYMPSGKTPASMTAMVSPFITLDINKVERTGDGNVIYGGSYTNADLTQDTYFRELGMFARLYYPDTDTYSDTILYSYGNAGNTADLIPAYGPGQFVERQMNLVVYVGNEAEVSLEISSDLFIPVSEKGQPSGVATLDDSGKVPAVQLPTMDYLPLDGSKHMLADLRFAGNMGSIGGDGGMVNLAHRANAESDDWRYLRVSKPDDIADGLTLVDTTGSETQFYKVFGEHNLELMSKYFVPVAVYPASVE